MHYRYFTLEQRSHLESAMRARLDQAGMSAALERLHTPEFGVCQRCGGDIAFARLALEPTLTRCAKCAD
jgi:RNA polymerase-binding transcription factor DksA